MTEDLEKQRDALIGQAEHLVHEIDAMEDQVKSVPDDVLSTSPLEHEPSIKELYALIGLYDRSVYLPALRAMIANENPQLVEREDAELLSGGKWNEEPFVAVLDFVRDARTELLGLVTSLPAAAWESRASIGGRSITLFEVVYSMVQHDAEILRAAARRMHDSRW